MSYGPKISSPFGDGGLFRPPSTCDAAWHCIISQTCVWYLRSSQFRPRGARIVGVWPAPLIGTRFLASVRSNLSTSHDDRTKPELVLQLQANASDRAFDLPFAPPQYLAFHHSKFVCNAPAQTGVVFCLSLVAFIVWTNGLFPLGATHLLKTTVKLCSLSLESP